MNERERLIEIAARAMAADRAVRFPNPSPLNGRDFDYAAAVVDALGIEPIISRDAFSGQEGPLLFIDTDDDEWPVFRVRALEVGVPEETRG